jgi:hypothetical protein
MNKIIKKINHCLGFAFIIIAHPVVLKAQNTPSSIVSPVFMTSSVGSFANTFNNIPAIQFKSTAACIDVQSGIVIFNGERGNGQFAAECEVAIKFNNLGASLYPNPAANTTKLKIKNTPSFAKLYKIDIWTMEGVLVNTRKGTGYSLTQGINIDLTGLQQGAFILRIESTESIDAIKFIKTE